MIDKFIKDVFPQFAQCAGRPSDPTVGVPSVIGLFCAIVNTINLLLVFAGSIALLFLLYGGIQYIISGGDEKALLTAKNTITFAILGLFLVLGSLVGVNLLFTVLQVK